MKKYILAIIVILLATSVIATTFEDLKPEQVPIYWDCISACWTVGYTRECALGCIDKAAKYEEPKNSCTDTDGYDIFNKGKVVSQWGVDEDYCYNIGKYQYLLEATCDGNTPVIYQQNCKELGDSYICKNGACVTSEPPNNKPVWEEIKDVKGKVDEPIDFYVKATDKDNDYLYYWIENEPTGSFLYWPGHFIWNSPKEGTHKVTFVVWDGEVEVKKTIKIIIEKAQKLWCKDNDGLDYLKKSSAEDTFTKAEDYCFDKTKLFEQGCVNDKRVEFHHDCKEHGQSYICKEGKCINTNKPPTLEKISDRKLAVGGKLNIILKGSDANNDKLTYSADGKTLNGNTFTWVPEKAGVYEFTFTVSDGLLTATEKMEVVVIDNLKCGEVVKKKEYFGLDGTALQYKKSDKISDTAPKVKFKNFDNGEYIERYISGNGNQVEFYIKLDGKKHEFVSASKPTSDNFDIKYYCGPPVFDKIGDKKVKEGKKLEFKVTAKDPNGGKVILYASKPKGATFKDGVYTWTPTYKQAGVYDVTFSAENEWGFKTYEHVKISVLDATFKCDDVWVVKGLGNFFHYDGKKWRYAWDKLGPDLFSMNTGMAKDGYGIKMIWGTDKNNVWISKYASGGPELLFYNGEKWHSKGNGPLNTLFHAMWGSSKDNIWASGSNSKLFHYDGSKWTYVQKPVKLFNQVEDMWGGSSKDIWAVGGSIMHYDGNKWSQSTSLDFSKKKYLLSGVSGSGPNDVWAVGTGRLMHYDGKKWTDYETNPKIIYSDVYAAAKDDVWIVGGANNKESILLHYDGKKWSNFPHPKTIGLKAIWASGPTDVWVISYTNYDGTSVLHYDGKTWTKEQSGVIMNDPRNLWGSCKSDTNNPPVLNKIGDKTINDGDTLSFSISATDKDNDLLTYSATGLPKSATFNNGKFTWTPKGQIGEYKVTFKVSDGKKETSETINIKVTKKLIPDCVVPKDGMKISKDTTFCKGTYKLSNGIFVTSDNIKLSCDETIISGTNEKGKNGIDISNRKNIQIIKCSISGYDIGIKANGFSKNNKIENNEISAIKDGILLNGAEGNKIENNKLSKSDNGINLGLSALNNVVSGNTLQNKGNDFKDGIILGEGSNSNTISKNIITWGNRGVILYKNSDSNIITENTINGNYPKGGLFIYSSKKNTIKNNYIESVQLSNSQDNLIDNNKFTSHYAIYMKITLENSNKNVVSNNIFNKGQYGTNILIKKSHDNIIKNNVLIEENKGGAGIENYNSNNNIFQNNKISLASIGMSLSGSNLKLENNEVYNNDKGIILSTDKGNSIVTKNNIHNNKKIGIKVGGTSKNTIIFTSNIVSENYENIIIPKDTFVTLDKNYVGNYWSNYDQPSEGCDDTNNNNICDFPYVIDKNNKDNFPYNKPNGWK